MFKGAKRQKLDELNYANFNADAGYRECTITHEGYMNTTPRDKAHRLRVSGPMALRKCVGCKVAGASLRGDWRATKGMLGLGGGPGGAHLSLIHISEPTRLALI
eukprot:8272248-Alexandrium_andersonii.AAC.1